MDWNILNPNVYEAADYICHEHDDSVWVALCKRAGVLTGQMFGQQPYKRAIKMIESICSYKFNSRNFTRKLIHLFHNTSHVTWTEKTNLTVCSVRDSARWVWDLCVPVLFYSKNLLPWHMCTKHTPKHSTKLFILRWIRAYLWCIMCIYISCCSKLSDRCIVCTVVNSCDGAVIGYFNPIERPSHVYMMNFYRKSHVKTCSFSFSHSHFLSFYLSNGSDMLV